MEERTWPNLVAVQGEAADAVDALYDRIGVLSAQIHALGAELVQTLAEFDAADGWVGDGYKTFSQWISTRTRFSVPESRRLSHAATAAASMPTLMAAAREGQVSVGVLADAARVVTPENESRVADVVLACTAAQSSRVLSKFRDLSAVPDPAGSSSGDAAGSTSDPTPESWWRMWWDDAGRGRIDAALDPVTAEMMRQAWAAARAAGERAADGSSVDGVTLNRAEADGRLSADEIASRLAATMLDHADAEDLRAPGGDRFVVQLHVDVQTFAELMGLEFDASLPVRLGSECFLAGSGRHLTRAQAAELACGARVQVLIESDGVPLWMSSEPAAANRWQRRAMASRSGGGACCELPGCTQTEYLHAHHVVYRSHDGRTSLENLVFLCGDHHRKLHRNKWTVTTEGDQRFTFWDGRKCLGTTVVGERAGRPPDLSQLPFVEHPPDAPPGITATATLADTGGERMTPWAMSAYLEHLFAA